jgi:predicted CopG family antitoxin
MNRRTTISADSEALETLEAEARRRGSSLSSVIAELVEEKAITIRRQRRPRLGIAHSTDGRTAAETATEPAARPLR